MLLKRIGKVPCIRVLLSSIDALRRHLVISTRRLYIPSLRHLVSQVYTTRKQQDIIKTDREGCACLSVLSLNTEAGNSSSSSLSSIDALRRHFTNTRTNPTAPYFPTHPHDGIHRSRRHLVLSLSPGLLPSLGPTAPIFLFCPGGFAPGQTLPHLLLLVAYKSH